MTSLIVRPQKRIKYYPLWHLLAEDGSVIAALSEAQLKTSGISVTPEVNFSAQWKVMSEMYVGEVVMVRKLENNHSVMAPHHTIAKIVRVA